MKFRLMAKTNIPKVIISGKQIKWLKKIIYQTFNNIQTISKCSKRTDKSLAKNIVVNPSFHGTGRARQVVRINDVVHI